MEAITSIIKSLALSVEYEEETVGELWSAFFGELDSDLLNPKEITSPSNSKQSVYEYDYGSGRKSVTFGEFTKEVSRYRIAKQ